MNERKGFLLAVIALLSFVGYLMVKPFMGYIFAAILLSFLLTPLQKRISKRIDERVTALLLVAFSMVLFVLPFIFTAAAVIDDARGLSQDVNRSQIINTSYLEQKVMAYTGFNVDVESNLNSASQQFMSSTFGNFSQIIGVFADITVGLSVMLFLMYYLLKDGQKLVGWLGEAAPFSEEIKQSMKTQINDTTWAVIKGHVLIAVTQGLIAGIGLAITGVPNYALWTFVMVLLGFIPVIGTIIVWLPAAGYLFLVGEPARSFFLLLYGFTIVGLTDNVLRPLIVDRAANLHPAIVLIGVIGGVYLFGAVGLFIGPILLGVLKAVVLVFKNNYQDL